MRRATTPPAPSRGVTAAFHLLLGALLACGPTPGEDADPPPLPPAAAATAERGASAAREGEVEAEVRRAFAASRDALRTLDVEAYLAGYVTGEGLVVVDPAGEFAGRAAFESYVRPWFAEARRRGSIFPIVTARERVTALDDSTAAVVVHWSVPGAALPYRSLLVYRLTAEGWRIAAEHSAEAPPDEPAGGASRDSSAEERSPGEPRD